VFGTYKTVTLDFLFRSNI